MKLEVSTAFHLSCGYPAYNSSFSIFSSLSLSLNRISVMVAKIWLKDTHLVSQPCLLRVLLKLTFPSSLLSSWTFGTCEVSRGADVSGEGVCGEEKEWKGLGESTEKKRKECEKRPQN